MSKNRSTGVSLHQSIIPSQHRVLPLHRRNKFGRWWIYPTGPLAPHVQALVGRPTLKAEELEALRSLGFTLTCAHCGGVYGQCEETK